MTTYVILSGPWSGQTWEEIDRIEASSHGSAIRKAYEKHGKNEPARFCAIPARSFVPTHVRPEVKTTIRLAAATAPTTSRVE